MCVGDRSCSGVPGTPGCRMLTYRPAGPDSPAAGLGPGGGLSSCLLSTSQIGVFRGAAEQAWGPLAVAFIFLEDVVVVVVVTPDTIWGDHEETGSPRVGRVQSKHASSPDLSPNLHFFSFLFCMRVRGGGV